MNWGYSTIKDQFMVFTKYMYLTKIPSSTTKFNISFGRWPYQNFAIYCTIVNEGQHTLTCFPEYNLQKQKEDPKSK